MLYDKHRYDIHLISPTNKIQVGSNSKIQFRILDVFHKTEDFDVDIRILVGNAREKTEALTFTPTSKELPYFTYESDFSSIPTGNGAIEIRILESDGSYVVLKEQFNIEFI